MIYEGDTDPKSLGLSFELGKLDGHAVVRVTVVDSEPLSTNTYSPIAIHGPDDKRPLISLHSGRVNVVHPYIAGSFEEHRQSQQRSFPSSKSWDLDRYIRILPFDCLSVALLTCTLADEPRMRDRMQLPPRNHLPNPVSLTYALDSSCTAMSSALPNLPSPSSPRMPCPATVTLDPGTLSGDLIAAAGFLADLEGALPSDIDAENMSHHNAL